MDTEKPSTTTNIPFQLESLPKLKSSNIKTGPLSLEMCNHAASDLNDKGVINLKKYSKYLNKKSKLIKMAYAADEKIPKTLFVATVN